MFVYVLKHVNPGYWLPFPTIRRMAKNLSKELGASGWLPLHPMLEAYMLAQAEVSKHIWRDIAFLRGRAYVLPLPDGNGDAHFAFMWRLREGLYGGAVVVSPVALPWLDKFGNREAELLSAVAREREARLHLG